MTVVTHKWKKYGLKLSLGTQVGDPIEFKSIRGAFMKQSRRHGIVVGSVKDNISHAEAASGSAGVIKVLLMMQHRMILKQANFKTINRKIGICEGISVPTSTTSWAAPKKIALVNNYGAAGSNAALLIREHPAV
jgi:acyl transferase domain-containing protein